MRPYQRERAPGGGGQPPPNYPNPGNPPLGPGAQNMPLHHPRPQSAGPPGGNVRSHGPGIPRPTSGPLQGANNMSQQQLMQGQNHHMPATLPGGGMVSQIPNNPRPQSGAPGSRPKPLPGISGSKIAAGRVAQGRNVPFQGQMPGMALSGSETDVSTSTENLTQVINESLM